MEKINMGIRFHEDICCFRQKKIKSRWFSPERKLAKKGIKLVKFYRTWADNIMKKGFLSGAPPLAVKGALDKTYQEYFQKLEELDG